jgi:hypothetical protein
MRIALILILLATPSLAHDLKHLPLGDTLKSDHPQKSHIWPCRIEPGGGGANIDGPWINFATKTFDKTAKPQVPGDVKWPSHFSITVKDGKRIFTGNGLPPHGTGIYPIPKNAEAYRYDQNPNSIETQSLTFSIPANPTLAEQPSCAPGAVGILLSGVPLFSAIDAPGRDAVAHEVQDKCDGHPQPAGIYHYHSLSPCNPSPGLVGYAIDGFGIFSADGRQSDDLDECHGTTSDIIWDGKKVTMYHYLATDDFPYTIGCLRGHFERSTVETLSGPPPGFFEFFKW